MNGSRDVKFEVVGLLGDALQFYAGMIIVFVALWVIYLGIQESRKYSLPQAVWPGLLISSFGGMLMAFGFTAIAEVATDQIWFGSPIFGLILGCQVLIAWCVTIAWYKAPLERISR